MEKIFTKTPIGNLLIHGNGSGLSRIELVEQPPASYRASKSAYLLQAVSELDLYLHGELSNFSVPLYPDGPDFHRQVWKLLREVPYGQTTSYLDIAMQLGDRNKVRAVGQANAKNPIPIFIPCHRVIGLKGDLTGFAWGLDIKKKLLSIENPLVFGEQASLF